jgi:hypothetical protein
MRSLANYSLSNGTGHSFNASRIVQSDTGENLVLRFEILIVKVPLFSLHGIQFKKVLSWNALLGKLFSVKWDRSQFQCIEDLLRHLSIMAKKILDALKL